MGGREGKLERGVQCRVTLFVDVTIWAYYYGYDMLRWVRHVASKINTKIWWWNVKEKTCFGITCVKCLIILKWSLKEIVWEVTDWIHVPLYCEKWRFLFNAVLNFRGSTQQEVIYGPAEEVAAFQAALCNIELLSFSKTNHFSKFAYLTTVYPIFTIK